MRNFLANRDETRAVVIKDKALELKRKYISGCKKCMGAGRILTDEFDYDMMVFKTIDCKCKKRYLRRLNLLMAGVEYKTIEKVIKKKIIERPAAEWDIAKKKRKKPFKLKADLINPYLSKPEVVTENGYSLLLLGVNSLGKTFLSLKILDKFLRRGYTGHYIEFRTLMKMINKSLVESGERRVFYDSFVNEIKDVDLLIIDEIAKETGSIEHIVGEIHELMKKRDRDKKPTILISNEDYEGFEDIYSLNVASIMMESYRVIIFDPAKDFRKMVRKDWKI